jgi:hypothetical protein
MGKLVIELVDPAEGVYTVETVAGDVYRITGSKALIGFIRQYLGLPTQGRPKGSKKQGSTAT